MIFTTERFPKVAIEPWTVLDFHPGPLSLVQMLWPTELLLHKFSSHAEQTLYGEPNFISF